RLRNGQRNILQRHDAHRLESVGMSRAKLRDVVIAGLDECQSESRIAQSATRKTEAPKNDLDVDAFGFEVFQPRFGIGDARPAHRHCDSLQQAAFFVLFVSLVRMLVGMPLMMVFRCMTMAAVFGVAMTVIVTVTVAMPVTMRMQLFVCFIDRDRGIGIQPAFHQHPDDSPLVSEYARTPMLEGLLQIAAKIFERL